MVKIKIGNILDSTEEILVHQVNTWGVMGGGVAKQLAKVYPNLEKEYAQYCKSYDNNFNQLKGKICAIDVNDKIIANMFSEEGNFNTDYDAIKEGLYEVKDAAKQFGLNVCMPFKIGCGSANGNWDVVYKIIEDVFEDYQVTLYKLEKNFTKKILKRKKFVMINKIH